MPVFDSPRSPEARNPGDGISLGADDGRLGRVVAGVEETVPVIEGNARFIETRRLDPHGEAPPEQAPGQGSLASRRRGRQSREPRPESLEGGGAVISSRAASLAAAMLAAHAPGGHQLARCGSEESAEIDQGVEYYEPHNRGERQDWGEERTLKDEHGYSVTKAS